MFGAYYLAQSYLGQSPAGKKIIRGTPLAVIKEQVATRAGADLYKINAPDK